MSKKENRDLIHQTIYHAAQAKGALAGAACTPRPMVVQQHENVMDDTSPVEQTWEVPSGVCGFAWVVIRNAGCSFARWCKKHGHGRTSSYGSGLSIWIRGYGQSYEKKVAHAHAMAEYLHKVGIDVTIGHNLD